MSNDNKVLSEKLAKRAGFTWYDEPCSEEGCSGHCGWRYPSGEKMKRGGSLGLPDFTKSLDAISKHLLVPMNIMDVNFSYASNAVTCDTEADQPLPSVFFEGHVDVESWEEGHQKAPLALCLALEDQIDKEG